jgi:hypothetical protein
MGRGDLLAQFRDDRCGAGMTFVERAPSTPNVIPAEAGTQCTEQQGPAVHWSDGQAALGPMTAPADIAQQGLGQSLAER